MRMQAAILFEPCPHRWHRQTRPSGVFVELGFDFHLADADVVAPRDFVEHERRSNRFNRRLALRLAKRGQR